MLRALFLQQLLYGCPMMPRSFNFLTISRFFGSVGCANSAAFQMYVLSGFFVTSSAMPETLNPS